MTERDDAAVANEGPECEVCGAFEHQHVKPGRFARPANHEFTPRATDVATTAEVLPPPMPQASCEMWDKLDAKLKSMGHPHNSTPFDVVPSDPPKKNLFDPLDRASLNQSDIRQMVERGIANVFEEKLSEFARALITDTLENDTRTSEDLAEYVRTRMTKDEWDARVEQARALVAKQDSVVVGTDYASASSTTVCAVVSYTDNIDDPSVRALCPPPLLVTGPACTVTDEATVRMRATRSMRVDSVGFTHWAHLDSAMMEMPLPKTEHAPRRKRRLIDAVLEGDNDPWRYHDDAPVVPKLRMSSVHIAERILQFLGSEMYLGVFIGFSLGSIWGIASSLTMFYVFLLGAFVAFLGTYGYLRHKTRSLRADADELARRANKQDKR